MAMKNRRVIPPLVIRRLTKYLAHVQVLCEERVEWVSSQELASTLGLTSSTVRQDLSYVEFSGISKRGYRTDGLQSELTQVLGVDKPWKMVVVGAGNLGRALAMHGEFPRRGFNICGIFDNDRRIVGRKVGRLTVQPDTELGPFVAREGIDIGVMAVPAAAAQDVADLLVRSGVRGLLNLALTHLRVPPHVCVIDSRIVASLVELSHALKYAEETGQGQLLKS